MPDLTWTSYTANETDGAAVFNSSGGLVTLNISGGTNPSYRNSSGASTVISNPVTHTLIDIVSGSEVTYVTPDDTGVLFHVETVNNGTTNYQYEFVDDTTGDILVHHLDYVPFEIRIVLGGSDATLPVSQNEDPFYFNP